MKTTISYSSNKSITDYIIEIKNAFHDPNCYVIHIVNVNEAARDEFYDQLTDELGAYENLGENAGSVEVGGKWTHVCFDPNIQNAYRSSSNPQPLHTDGSYLNESPDATFMYCIASAATGGETTFISGNKLVELLKQDHPDLFIQLSQNPVCFSRKFNNGKNEKTRLVIDIRPEKIILTWNYFRVDPEKNSPETLQMCNSFQEYLQNNIINSKDLLQLRLNAGEGVLWLDERLLHGRNGFHAKNYGDRNLAKTLLNLKSLTL